MGAPEHGAGIGVSGGAAYFFVRTGGVWIEEATFDEPGCELGTSVALSGDAAAVGGPFCGGFKVSGPGGVMFLARTGGVWAVDTLMFGGTPPYAGLGESVALHGDAALAAAAYWQDVDPRLFIRKSGVWTDQWAFPPGYTRVALSADTVLLGNPNDNENGPYAGAAYVFGWQETPPCTLDSECVSGFCADGVCCDSACGVGAPDDCQACNLPDHAGICTALPDGTSCSNGVRVLSKNRIDEVAVANAARVCSDWGSVWSFPSRATSSRPTLSGTRERAVSPSGLPADLCWKCRTGASVSLGR